MISKPGYPIFSVIGDGAMASVNLGEGRIIPVLIINPNDNHSLIELLKAHETAPPGDVHLRWAITKNFTSISSIIRPTEIQLVLEFTNPVSIKFGIRFLVETQFILVNGILLSRGFYLQLGDKYSKASDLESEKILVEVPFMEFDKIWYKLLLKHFRITFINKGYSRKQSREIAKDLLKSSKEQWKFRLNSGL